LCGTSIVMPKLEIAGRDTLTGKMLRVTIEEGLVADVREADGKDDGWLSTGLVDLQVNGFLGHDVNDPDLTVEDIAALVDAESREGVTRFLPTITTASEGQIVAALETIRRAREADPQIKAAIPFVHVEGPHISDEDGPRGAHPRSHVRPPSFAEFERWQKASGNLVGLVTMSPHFANSCAYIAALSKRGVHVAIGHTHASPDEIHAAAEAGAGLSTHLGNGAHASLPRHPNYIWSQLADDRLSAMFIADGHHLQKDAFVAMMKAKGVERSILVSDSVGFGGLAPGNYRRADGADVTLHLEGWLELRHSSYLAGGAMSLNSIVATALSRGWLSIAAALLMTTRNPGKILGDERQIVPGAKADLISFSWTPGDLKLGVRNVIASGRSLL
jgi:N-acetylglucosamine-6-phosphate deacetylase